MPARAPHVWTGDRRALMDEFGRDFTLMKLATDIDTSPFMTAAAAYGVPLDAIDVGNTEVTDLYASNLVLIRPDHHIAWRGDTGHDDADTLIRKLVGMEGVT